MGSGLTSLGSAATLEDNLPTFFQIQDKLTWTKGRHLLKFGGQWLKYNQQRYYAGNNGALGLFTYTGTFTGFAFADFLLDLVQNKGRGGGDPDNPWTHQQNRISLYVQDDFKVTANLTLNARPAVGVHVPADREGQPPGELRPEDGTQILAKDGSIEDRALYNRTTTAGSRASAPPTSWATSGCSAPVTASRSSWRAPAPTCACR